MSAHVEEHDNTIPPVGEEIHMPAPSILPLVNSAALAAMIVCITLSWWLVAIFGVVFLITTIRWVADVRRDIAELPLDHSHH
jgi:type IV secretory pathway TrbD component